VNKIEKMDRSTRKTEKGSVAQDGARLAIALISRISRFSPRVLTPSTHINSTKTSFFRWRAPAAPTVH
jgi:hypothetical protein